MMGQGQQFPQFCLTRLSRGSHYVYFYVIFYAYYLTICKTCWHSGSHLYFANTMMIIGLNIQLSVILKQKFHCHTLWIISFDRNPDGNSGQAFSIRPKMNDTLRTLWSIRGKWQIIYQPPWFTYPYVLGVQTDTCISGWCRSCHVGSCRDSRM